jgi:glucosamine kinase
VRFLLALDAGGSTTRALVLTETGEPRGRAVAGPGNPTAVGAERALAAIGAASAQALAAAGVEAGWLAGAVLATAGSERAVTTDRVRQALGLPAAAGFRRVSDLLAMYFSAVDDPQGAALIAGTGSVAARVAHRGLLRVAGGNGWLIGDGGSGFWIARRVLRAVTADLDGTGPATALTARVLATLGLPDDRSPREGRPFVLGELVDVVYAEQPVHLARVAPDCFAAAAAGDAVAAAIVRAAGDELAVLVRSVEGPGPLVVGGSVWRRGFAAPSGALAEALAGRWTAAADDGLLGAAVLALHERDRPTDVLREEFTALAAGAPPARS